jgi:hypothetical protein
MPTLSNRKPSFTFLAILNLISLAVFSGCDMGTYKQRLSESPAQQVAPQDPASEGADEASEAK